MIISSKAMTQKVCVKFHCWDISWATPYTDLSSLPASLHKSHPSKCWSSSLYGIHRNPADSIIYSSSGVVGRISKLSLFPFAIIFSTHGTSKISPKVSFLSPNIFFLKFYSQINKIFWICTYIFIP